MSAPEHPPGVPSGWITRWAHLVPPGAQVLDLACGSGRHLRWWAARACTVTGVDREAAALAGLAGLGELVLADIENSPWPLSGRQFDAVIVTHYLWRPLLPAVVAAVKPGGLLLYETFAAGNGQFGRPSRDDFLLRPGELLQAVGGSLQVLGYECGRLMHPDRLIQRLAARRPLELEGGCADAAVTCELPAWPRPGSEESHG